MGVLAWQMGEIVAKNCIKMHQIGEEWRCFIEFHADGRFYYRTKVNIQMVIKWKPMQILS